MSNFIVMYMGNQVFPLSKTFNLIQVLIKGISTELLVKSVSVMAKSAGMVNLLVSSRYLWLRLLINSLYFML